MLENPGAQIEADLVFRRRELSDIFRAIPSTISSPKTFPRPTPSFARKNLPVSVSLPLLLSPMYSLYFLKRKKKKSTTNSSPPPWEFLLSIHFQFIVSLLLLLLLEVNTWSSFLWFTFSSLLETRFERRFVEEIIRRDDFLGGRVFDCSSSKSRGEEEVEEGGVSASILAPPPEIQAGLD